MSLLTVTDLRTHFCLESGPVRAVDGVSFTMEQGEMLGLIGESGCGKSTLGLSLMRLHQDPCKIVGGSIMLEDRELLNLSEEQMRQVRWREIAMIPQSAMNALNPVMPIGEQIAEVVRLHLRAGRREATDRAREVLELVGIDPRRYSAYPHEFSGGMKQRVAIAMALSCEPKLVISDEATTGLDVMTQAQVIGLLRDLQARLRLSILFVSHDLPLVLDVCHRIAIMYAGHVVELRSSEEIRTRPMHPYTAGLISAFPPLFGPKHRVASIQGRVPNLADPPSGCRFHPRCRHAVACCSETHPTRGHTHHNGYVACHLISEEQIEGVRD